MYDTGIANWGRLHGTVICISRWVSPRVQIRCLRSRQSAAPQSESTSRAVAREVLLIGRASASDATTAVVRSARQFVKHWAEAVCRHRQSACWKGFRDRTPETLYRSPSELVGARINQADRSALCRRPPPTADCPLVCRVARATLSDQTDQRASPRHWAFVATADECSVLSLLLRWALNDSNRTRSPLASRREATPSSARRLCGRYTSTVQCRCTVYRSCHSCRVRK